MKYENALLAFDNDLAKLAYYCRCHRTAPFKWRVDSAGNIVNERVKDTIRSGILRMRADAMRAAGELSPYEADLIA